jgi:hypothetical protein
LRRETGYVLPLPPVQDFVAVGEAELSVDEDALVGLEVEDELFVLNELVVSKLMVDERMLVELSLWVEGVEVSLGVLVGVGLLDDGLGETVDELGTIGLLDAGRLLVPEVLPGVEEVVSGASGMGSVSVAKGLAFTAMVHAAGVVVAKVDEDDGVALQPVATDVFVVQLLLYNGVPERVLVVTGVHDTQLLVTVLVVHSGVAVVVVSVEVRLQPLSTDVLVVQLSVRTGVPDDVPLVTDVHEAHVLVTVEVEVHDVVVDEG